VTSTALYDLQKRLEHTAHKEARERAKKELHELEYWGRELRLRINKEEVSIHSSDLASQLIEIFIAHYKPKILEKRIDELLSTVDVVRELGEQPR